MESFWKNIIFVNMGLKNVFFWKLYVLGTVVVRAFRFFFQWVHLFEIILWGWGTEHDKFSINKIHKSLDVNAISIKKHEMEIW